MRYRLRHLQLFSALDSAAAEDDQADTGMGNRTENAILKHGTPYFPNLNTFCLFHVPLPTRSCQGRSDYTVRSRSPSRGQRPPSGGRGVGSKLGKVLGRVVGDVNRVLLLHAVICVLYGG